MPLLAQWVRQRPWLAAGIAGAAGGIAGIAHGFATMASTASALAVGGISTKRQANEHPFRARILRTLERHPGLCYRELQHVLSAANGTLRHHLDVMQNRGSITVMPVNGRTCYFAGGPSQVELLQSVSNDHQRVASSLPIGLSAVQRQIVDDILEEGIPRSQAQLARRIGRTRASVHSAVKVLRRRGILRLDVLDIAPHIEPETFRRTERLSYSWDDGRGVRA